MKRIEVSYYILNNILGTFNTIHINAKPDMTISIVFDAVRRKHKNDKNIIEIRLLDVENIKGQI